MVIVRMILRRGKVGTGWCKVEEQVFGGDCKGGWMHNQGYKNEEATNIL